ncbi:MAG: hypothetical protein R2684_04870 [Pyrinomonadaceae bacterium]
MEFKVDRKSSKFQVPEVPSFSGQLFGFDRREFKVSMVEADFRR